MRVLILILIICNYLNANSQSLGGNAVFSFLQQSNTPQLSALGGYNISTITNDVGMTFNNPALLRKEMHHQLSASFNNFLAGIKNYSLITAFYIPNQSATAALGINYFNYGSITQTDASGNIIGSFTPSDYVIQFSLSKQHKENWWYGSTLKFVNSAYGNYKSNAIALDLALNYVDSSKFFQAAIVVKNLGSQLKKYSLQSNKEELPFDVQIGITKRLPKAPLQFSLTAHHLHIANILYNDTLYNQQEGDDSYKRKNYTAEKILSHLVLSAEVLLSKQFQFSLGYNFLRRHDLNTYNSANGLNGINVGLSIKMKQFQFNYATGFYQRNMYNQIALNFNLSSQKK